MPTNHKNYLKLNKEKAKDNLDYYKFKVEIINGVEKLGNSCTYNTNELFHNILKRGEIPLFKIL